MNSGDNSFSHGKLALFEYFWEHSQDNLFIVELDEDNDFVIKDINPAQAKNFNLTKEKVINTKLKDCLGENAAKEFESKYHQCLHINQPLIKNEKVFVSDTFRHWNTMMIPMTRPQSKHPTIFGIAREFTELAQANEALEALNKQLEDRVKERTIELEVANAELKKLAFTDPLTGLGNRRYLEEHATAMIALAKRLENPISILYIDLDYFKKINDTYGHENGDKVLKEFASLLRYISRESDIVCRYGGEEFVILLPFTDEKAGLEMAQRFQKAIHQHTFTCKDGRMLHITASMGVNTCHSMPNGLNDLLVKADEALYQAKEKGRDRIVICR